MPAPTDPAQLPKSFSALIGVSTTAILLQAVTAGVFVDQSGRDSWVTVHGVIADATWVTALLAAVVAFRQVRRAWPALWAASAALFLLALAQTGLGHLITDGGQDWLLAVHVPLAMVIFGLAIWLAVATARLRRGSPVDPYGADRPVANVSRSLTGGERSGR